LSKAAGADAVYALLVLLDLLERDAELVAEVSLAHLLFEATLADPDADRSIGCGRGPRTCWLSVFAHRIIPCGDVTAIK
jgi:hypothetical protein